MGCLHPNVDGSFDEYHQMGVPLWRRAHSRRPCSDRCSLFHQRLQVIIDLTNPFRRMKRKFQRDQCSPKFVLTGVEGGTLTTLNASDNFQTL